MSATNSEAKIKKGWMKKQGRSGLIKNWKKRYFILKDGTISYYDEAEKLDSLKGQLYLAETEIKDETKKRNENQIYIVSFSGENNLLIEFDNKNDVDDWLLAIKSHINFADSHSSEVIKENDKKLTSSSTTEAPSLMRGWLMKQGRGTVKSWKKRYFVLNNGTISYYEIELKEFPYGDGFKGDMYLDNSTVSLENMKKDTQFYISTKNSEKHLLVEAESKAEVDMWIELVKRHITYANIHFVEAITNNSRDTITAADIKAASRLQIAKTSTDNNQSSTKSKESKDSNQNNASKKLEEEEEEETKKESVLDVSNNNCKDEIKTTSNSFGTPQILFIVGGVFIVLQLIFKLFMNTSGLSFLILGIIMIGSGYYLLQNQNMNTSSNINKTSSSTNTTTKVTVKTTKATSSTTKSNVTTTITKDSIDSKTKTNTVVSESFEDIDPHIHTLHKGKVRTSFVANDFDDDESDGDRESNSDVDTTMEKGNNMTTIKPFAATTSTTKSLHKPYKDDDDSNYNGSTIQTIKKDSTNNDEVDSFLQNGERVSSSRNSHVNNKNVSI